MNSGKDLTVKYDGAPSIVAGTDPEDGRFFLATKAIFNKTPHYYKSREEIEKDNLKEGLRNALLDCWDAMVDQHWGCIAQGDLMWDSTNLDTRANTYVVFGPNVIKYMMTNSPEVHRARQCKVGVVWHTLYTGPSLRELSATRKQHFVFAADSDLYSFGARLYPGKIVTFPTLDCVVSLDPVNVVPANVLPHLKRAFADPHGQLDLANPLDYITNVVYYKGEQEAAKRKTKETKARIRREHGDVIRWIVDNEKYVRALLDHYIEVRHLKMWAVKQLNALAPIPAFTYVNTRPRKCDQEGFVFWYKDQPVKLVDRNGFARLNALNSPYK